MEQMIPELADFCQMYADITRLNVLLLLRNGEMGFGELEKHSGSSGPLLSHHLALLADGGLITQRKEGRHTYWSLTPRTRQMEQLLNIMLTGASPQDDGETIDWNHDPFLRSEEPIEDALEYVFNAVDAVLPTPEARRAWRQDWVHDTEAKTGNRYFAEQLLHTCSEDQCIARLKACIAEQWGIPLAE